MDYPTETPNFLIINLHFVNPVTDDVSLKIYTIDKNNRCFTLLKHSTKNSREGRGCNTKTTVCDTMFLLVHVL